MSPEQAQGIKSVDSRSDLWSLAVIVFQCLTAGCPSRARPRRPPREDHRQPDPHAVGLQPGAPAELRQWWLKAADRNPDNRFQTAKAFAESLGLALGQSSVTDVSDRSRLLRQIGSSTALMTSPEVASHVPSTPMMPWRADRSAGDAQPAPADAAAAAASAVRRSAAADDADAAAAAAVRRGLPGQPGRRDVLRPRSRLGQHPEERPARRALRGDRPARARGARLGGAAFFKGRARTAPRPSSRWSARPPCPRAASAAVTASAEPAPPASVGRREGSRAAGIGIGIGIGRGIAIGLGGCHSGRGAGGRRASSDPRPHRREDQCSEGVRHARVDHGGGGDACRCGVRAEEAVQPRLLNRDGPRARAESLIRTTCALPEAALRAAFLRDLLLRSSVTSVAPVLDVICERAEQAEGPAREALVALVDALNHESCVHAVQLLREEASGVPHLALERLVRKPVSMVPARDVGRPEGRSHSRLRQRTSADARRAEVPRQEARSRHHGAPLARSASRRDPHGARRTEGDRGGRPRSGGAPPVPARRAHRDRAPAPLGAPPPHPHGARAEPGHAAGDRGADRRASHAPRAAARRDVTDGRSSGSCALPRAPRTAPAPRSSATFRRMTRPSITVSPLLLRFPALERAHADRGRARGAERRLLVATLVTTAPHEQTAPPSALVTVAAVRGRCVVESIGADVTAMSLGVVEEDLVARGHEACGDDFGGLAHVTLATIAHGATRSTRTRAT